jgi:hypothetical protein
MSRCQVSLYEDGGDEGVVFRREECIVAVSPGSIRGLVSRWMLMGVEARELMCLRMLSGLRKPIDCRKHCRVIVTTRGRAALTLSEGRGVRGEVRDGDGLAWSLGSIG